MNEYIDFKVSMVKDKPVTVHGGDVVCPFCDWDALRKSNVILSDTPHFLWMENKFPTFDDSYQTVLVEHVSCDLHLGTYEEGYRQQLIAHAVSKWMEVEQSGKFKSVCMIKNHGPLSGASIKHPHMQIVGFENADIYHDIEKSNFEGEVIYQDDDVEFNISLYPRGESYEFNVMITSLEHIAKMADMIGTAVNYICNRLNAKHESFNLIFYHFQNEWIVKIVPRFITSVYVVGYAVSLRPNNIKQMASDIKDTLGGNYGTSSS